MSATNYPNGVTANGVPQLGGGDLLTTGKIIYVDNSNSNKSDANVGDDKDFPLATLDKAIEKVTASKGDVILVGSGHAETISAAAGILVDVVGVTIRGLGSGNDRPKITISTLIGAGIRITAASCKISNLIIITNFDALTSAIDVRAADCEIDIEHRDTSSLIEAATVILTTNAADRLKVRLVHRGFTAGDAGVSGVKLIGVTGARIYVDYYGKASTAIVDMATEASDDVQVLGRFHNAGTSDLSKSVKDSIGGSLWNVHGFDTVAGGWFSGGDIQAVAQDDVATVIAALYGAAGVVTYPAAAAYANGVSLAEVVAYIQDGVRRGTGTTMAANKSVADALGTDGTTVTDGAVSVLGAIGADNANNAFASTLVVANKDGSVLERLEDITQELSGAAGLATWPAAAAPANGVSLAEGVRYIVENLWGTLVNTGGTATLGGILGDVANTSVATRLTNVTDALYGATGIVTWPAAAAPANGVSLAEAVRYIVESLVGTLVNTGGTATLGGMIGDPANSSLVARLALVTDALYGANGIVTYPAAAVPANAVSIAEVLREVYNQQEKAISTAAAIMALGDTTIFTIAGGPIEVVELLSVCTSLNDATAATLQYQADPTDGGVTALSIASASLAAKAAGTTALCTGTFGAAPTLTDNGVVAAGTTKFIVPAGIIKITIAVGATTGQWTHHLRYKPLARGVTVS